MIKKLKIRFVKFEHALVAQQLEIEGIHHFVENMHTQFSPFFVELRRCGICIQVEKNCFGIARRIFANNAERDEYLEKVVERISEEQFATKGKLEIGNGCEVSDNREDWVERRLIAVLPENYSNRYIAQTCDDKNKWTYWNYARSIDFIQPKIEGDIYTWEMEVSE